jgi:hypothetical protein
VPRGQPLKLASVALLAALALGLGSLVACARPVEVVVPASPAPEVEAACAVFTAALPAELATVGERRDVTPESDLTAAYGDPPVGVRCGVPDPTALEPTSTLVTVEGIDWLPEELTGGWRMTSVGRIANVEITVPTEQGPAPSVAADLSPTITASLPPAG